MENTIYRLRYYDKTRSKVADAYVTCSIAHDYFKLPKGMSEQEAFDVISYILLVTEKENPFILKSKVVELANRCLDRFGFKKAENKANNYEKKDLYVIENEDSVINEKNYFSWFNKNIKEEQIKEIYKKIHVNIKNKKR